MYNIHTNKHIIEYILKDALCFRELFSILFLQYAQLLKPYHVILDLSQTLSTHIKDIKIIA